MTILCRSGDNYTQLSLKKASPGGGAFTVTGVLECCPPWLRCYEKRFRSLDRFFSFSLSRSLPMSIRIRATVRNQLQDSPRLRLRTFGNGHHRSIAGIIQWRGISDCAGATFLSCIFNSILHFQSNLLDRDSVSTRKRFQMIPRFRGL
jgi:hypothetical protein